MIHVVEFAFVVIAVSASGVMSPGPLFAANISHGLCGGVKSGIKMAIGHTVVEFPLVILLGIGTLSLGTFPEFRTLISILGAITLFVFAFMQIRTVLRTKKGTIPKQKQRPIMTGIVFSALNPFFIIWWLTIGLKLISDAMLIWAFGGMLILFILHIWMDFAWLGGTAFLASKTMHIISNRNYKVLIIGLNMMLIYFGITFLSDIET